MAVDAAVSRVDPVSPFLGPVSNARSSKVGPTDYSERLTREMSRDDGRVKPAEPSSPSAARSTPSRSERQRTVAEARNEANTESREAKLEPKSVDGAQEPAESPDAASSNERAETDTQARADGASETTEPSVPEGATVVADVVDSEEVIDDAALLSPQQTELPATVVAVAQPAPRPPWSPEEPAPADKPARPSSNRQEPIAVPAAVVTLLVGKGEQAEGAVVATESEGSDGETPAPPGFVHAILPAEPGVKQLAAVEGVANAEPPAIGMPAVVEPQAAEVTPSFNVDAKAEGVVATEASAESAEMSARPVNEVPAATPADGQENPAADALVIAEESPIAAVSSPVSSSIDSPSRPASPATSAATKEQATITPVTEVRADDRGQTAVSPVEQDAVSDASRTAPAADSLPVIEAVDEAITVTAESAENSTGADTADPAPRIEGGRPAESLRSHRIGKESTATFRTEAAAGDDFVQNAASALRAADGLDRPIKIRLTPPELGVLRVEVSRQDGKVTAQFEVTTTAAQATLNDQLSTLRESLGRAGVTVERIEVRLAEPAREEGRPGDGREGQGQGRQSQDDGSGRQREQRHAPTAQTDADDQAAGVNDPMTAPAGDMPAARNVADELDIQI